MVTKELTKIQTFYLTDTIDAINIVTDRIFFLTKPTQLHA